MDNIYIDNFIKACKGVFESFGLSLEAGEISTQQSPFSANSIVIVVGVTGGMHGQVLLYMSPEVACSIASIMMGGMDVKLDEITKSAIAELLNMIVGNAVTLLSKYNILIDITPPSVMTGENIYISTSQTNHHVELCLDNGDTVGFTLSAKEIV